MNRANLVGPAVVVPKIIEGDYDPKQYEEIKREGAQLRDDATDART